MIETRAPIHMDEQPCYGQHLVFRGSIALCHSKMELNGIRRRIVQGTSLLPAPSQFDRDIIKCCVSREGLVVTFTMLSSKL